MSDRLVWTDIGLVAAADGYRPRGRGIGRLRRRHPLTPQPKENPMDATDILNRFEFHPATKDTGPYFDDVRASCRALADHLNELIPDGREKSLAITHLEEVMFWSNAAVARS